MTRQLRVTTVTNTKLLYMTSRAFLHLFGKYELEKLREFCEVVDLKEIEERVSNHWKLKKKVTKQLNEAVVDNTNKENRLKGWANKVQEKKANLPEMMLEESRIEVIEHYEVSKKVLNLYIMILTFYLFFRTRKSSRINRSM